MQFRFLLMGAGMLCCAAAGQAYSHGAGMACVGLFVLGAFFLGGYGHESIKQGAQPMYGLKPFRQYVVVRVAEKWSTERYLMVVKYHVDYGHWEYRLINLRWSLVGEPEPGQELWADGRGLHSGRYERAA